MAGPSEQVDAFRRELATQRRRAEAMRDTAADQLRQTAVFRRDNAIIRSAAAEQRALAADQRLRAAVARGVSRERSVSRA